MTRYPYLQCAASINISPLDRLLQRSTILKIAATKNSSSLKIINQINNTLKRASLAFQPVLHQGNSYENMPVISFFSISLAWHSRRTGGVQQPRNTENTRCKHLTYKRRVCGYIYVHSYPGLPSPPAHIIQPCNPSHLAV